MEFLDKSVLPQSLSHMILLKYLLVLTFIIFYTYVGILFGSLSFSLYFRRKAVKTGNKLYQKFSKDLIDQITFNKGLAFALGMIPLLSAAFCYAQLLHLTNVNVPEYLLVSLIFLFVAMLLIYTYKYTFHLKDIFKFAGEKKESGNEGDSIESEIKSYEVKTSRLHQKSGLYGLILLVIATYIFTGANELASDTSRWKEGSGFFSMLFDITTIIYYIQFLATSIAVTSATILYYFYRPDNPLALKSIEPASPSLRSANRGEYYAFVKSFALKSGLISTISLPAFIALTIFVKPLASLSFGLFTLTTVALMFLLFLSSMYYFMIKESHLRYRASVIYIIVIVLAFLIIKDQFSFDTATKEQTALLAANFDQYEKKMAEASGTAAPAINGADIYNGRCIACHSFDHRVVGPPYNQTIPKYVGHKDELVKFIMNPVKKNPGYPAMPNQGLKPAEADAVADWLLSHFKK